MREKTNGPHWDLNPRPPTLRADALHQLSYEAHRFILPQNSHKNHFFFSRGCMDAQLGKVTNTWFCTVPNLWNALYIILCDICVYSISIQALGQHEFDLKVEGLATFLRSASFPAIASNIDITKEPSLNGLLLQYHIVNFTTGEQVGIVGYSYEDTPDSVDTGSFSNDARQAIALKTNFKET